MKFIGLTGGIATGKSTVSNTLRELGVPVIDADELAREVVAPGTFGLRALVENFGLGILQTSGREARRSGDEVAEVILDRARLAALIFKDPAARLVVERITHPLIQWRGHQEKEFFRARGEGLVFYDAALIFEKNLAANFDGVVVVHTSEETQAKRLALRDKMSAEEIERRLSAQLPISEKVSRAHHLIDNESSLELTRHQVKLLVEKLRAG